MIDTKYISTFGKAGELVIRVRSAFPAQIEVRGMAENEPSSVFFVRKRGTGAGDTVIRIPMPLSPTNTDLEIQLSSNAHVMWEVAGFEALQRLKKERIKPQKSVADFLEHALIFARDSGNYQAGYTYMDSQNRFPIHYMDGIYNNKGQRINTPARISRKTGEIEVDANAWVGLTVANRMQILLHEFGHYYKQTKSEAAADKFALRLYLGLGFPKSEAVYTYTRSFHDSPAMNKRVGKLIKGIRKYRN